MVGGAQELFPSWMTDGPEFSMAEWSELRRLDPARDDIT
jgi:hypothetical protein